jgi:hypothetical protein
MDVYRRNDAAYKIELAQFQHWMKEKHSDAPFSVGNTTQANRTANRQNNQHMPKKEDVTTPVHSRKVDCDGGTRRYLPVKLENSILSDRRNVAAPYELELVRYPRWMKESHSDAPFSAVSTTHVNGTASRQNNQLVPKKQDVTTQAPSRKNGYDGGTRRYLPVKLKNSILPRDKMQNDKYYHTQPIALSEMLSHTIDDVEQELFVYASFLEKGLVKVDEVLTKLN